MQQHAQSALLICGHGSNGGPANSMKALASQLAMEDRFSRVEMCCLYGSPTPAEALKNLEGVEQLTVLPFMLAEGYASKIVLPRAFKECGRALSDRDMLPVLGRNPLLASVAIDMASRTAHAKGWTVGETELILLGHGSNRHPNSGGTSLALAEQLSGRGLFKHVSTLFLDQAPYARETVTPSPQPRVIIGMFADRSVHGDQDGKEVAALGGANTVYAGPLGAEPQFLEVARDTLARYEAAEG